MKGSPDVFHNFLSLSLFFLFPSGMKNRFRKNFSFFRVFELSLTFFLFRIEKSADFFVFNPCTASAFFSENLNTSLVYWSFSPCEIFENYVACFFISISKLPQSVQHQYLNSKFLFLCVKKNPWFLDWKALHRTLNWISLTPSIFI